MCVHRCAPICHGKAQAGQGHLLGASQGGQLHLFQLQPQILADHLSTHAAESGRDADRMAVCCFYMQDAVAILGPYHRCHGTAEEIRGCCDNPWLKPACPVSSQSAFEPGTVITNLASMFVQPPSPKTEGAHRLLNTLWAVQIASSANIGPMHDQLSVVPQVTGLRGCSDMNILELPSMHVQPPSPVTCGATNTESAMGC